MEDIPFLLATVSWVIQTVVVMRVKRSEFRVMRLNTRDLVNIALRLGIIFGIALGINYIWEMAQMPFYQEMRYSDPRAWFMCFRASLGDALFTVAVFLGGWLLFRHWDWPKKLSLLKGAFLVFVGATAAIVTEIVALEQGRWAYTRLMPLLPILGVGLVPVIQLAILPWISFKLALLRNRMEL